MKSGDPDHQAGSMAKREEYKTTTKLLYSLRQEQGKVNSKFRRKTERGYGINWTWSSKSDWSGDAKIGENISPQLRLPLHRLGHKIGGVTIIGRMITGRSPMPR